MQKSIEVYAHLYQDYNCPVAIKLTWQCHNREFSLDGIPLHAAWYKCNEYGIVVYDDNFKIIKVAPMQHYRISKNLEIRYFLMHVYDSNLLKLIDTVRAVPLTLPDTSVIYTN